MSTARALCGAYGIQSLAILLGAACLLKTWATGTWSRDSERLLLGALGLVCVLASEATSEMSGYRSPTTQGWRQYPEEVVPWGGLLLLGYSAARVLLG